MILFKFSNKILLLIKCDFISRFEPEFNQDRCGFLRADPFKIQLIKQNTRKRKHSRNLSTFSQRDDKSYVFVTSDRPLPPLVALLSSSPLIFCATVKRIHYRCQHASDFSKV